MRRFAALVLFLLLPLSALAQDRANTILVLDGSGSMWGQIEGVAKITIAQDVVGGLLGSIPEEQQLGLTVYGHRTRGDCTDIESIVPPGPGTRNAIAAAVTGIKPLGKTPMTDAVIAAAQALRYTEEKATVILVSDGVETCNPDPCAAAQLLEEAGIDFTAHVVGFDVGSDVEALRQMQCIADNTGGLFLTADNAEELSQALTTVAVAEPEPVPYAVTVIATEGQGGPVITDGLTWTVGDAAGNVFLDNAALPRVEGQFYAGNYQVQVTRSEDGATAAMPFTVTDQTMQVVLVLPEPEPEPAPLTLRAVLGNENGPLITGPVIWTLSAGGQVIADNLQGNPLEGSLTEGAFTATAYRLTDELELSQQFVVIGSDPVSVTIAFPEILPTAELIAADSAPLGSTIPVGWKGPNEQNDYVEVGELTEDGWVNYSYTRSGNPVELVMPPRTGRFAIRYIRNDGRVVLGSREIEVTPIEVSVSGPDEAQIGSQTAIEWIGPDYANDYVAVSRPGEDGYINYSYTREGAPLNLQMPPEPGDYEIRYILNQDRVVMATTPIRVVAVATSLKAPETAAVGSTIEVGWEGPDEANDYIGIATLDDKTGYETYSYTRNGSPAELRLPTEPGQYELRYFLGQDRTILARRPITLTAVAASITAPESAVAGATLSVGWEGPDYQNDYIGVGKPGDDAYITYAYTRNGQPVDLNLPTEAGSYELRYYVGQDRTILARAPITLTAVSASLTAPAEGVAGATIDVGWDGPDYQNDYIGIGAPGADDYENYAYTRNGNPAELVLPTTPGAYELRYFVGRDRAILARVAINVTDVTASVQGPASAVAGDTISVTWEGPDYRNDYVAIARPDEDNYLSYAYTRNGDPAEVLVPTVPGEYEIRYYVNQDRKILARAPLSVTPVTASLSAAASAPIGATVDVTWDGPNYQNDYIPIGRADEERYISYAYSRNGSPAKVTMPDEPGTYELRYVMRQDTRTLAKATIEVTDLTVTLDAPDSAPKSTEIEVAWDGPGYQADIISIAPVGEERFVRYVNARNGNPSVLRLPDEPGQYELRYQLTGTRKVLATRPLTVTE